MITMCAICVQKLKIYSYIYILKKNELVALAKNINNVVLNKK